MAPQNRKKQNKRAKALQRKKTASAHTNSHALSKTVTIAPIKDEVEVAAANALFHKYLTNVGEDATELVEDSPGSHMWKPVALVAYDENDQIVGAIQSRPDLQTCERVGKIIAASGSRTIQGQHLDWPAHAYMAAEKIRVLSHLVVVPAARGQNIGMNLVIEAEKMERQKGAIHWMGLAEGDDENLWMFYEKLGFKITNKENPIGIDLPIPGERIFNMVMDPGLNRTGRMFYKRFMENTW